METIGKLVIVCLLFGVLSVFQKGIWGVCESYKESRSL